MWVRSQNNRFLTYCESFIIEDWRNNEFNIVDRTNGLVLGRYKTEKRAIEILDEIHVRILQKNNSINVYQMPEK